jgi:glycosyltransferase involved in cell wall biosynthesis
VLDAMQCGAVGIASRDPAIIEVAGDGAILLDVRDRALWLDALRSAVTQPGQMRGLREKALMRAGDFSWTKTARLTKAVYEHAIRRFRR